MKHAVGSPDSFLQETRSWISRSSQLCGSISLKNSGSIESVNLVSTFPMAVIPLSANMMSTWALLFMLLSPNHNADQLQFWISSSTHSERE